MAMPLGGSGSKAPFVLCPAGLQQAVCCDVIDHGKVKVPKFRAPGEFMLQHKFTVRWQSIHKMADGKPFIVQRRFTLSSHPKATIRAFLGNWRGLPLTDEQAEKFDVDTLIGKNAMILVTHVNKPAKGGVFQEVMMAAPVPKGIAKLTPSADYVLWRNRPENQPGYVAPPGGPAPASATAPASVDGVDPGYPSEWDSVDAQPGAGDPDQPNEEPDF